MSGYAVFFDYNNNTYRLPVNPEQIEVASTLAIEKYDILKLGQIAVPTHMELREYNFECEFPTAKIHSYSRFAEQFAKKTGLALNDYLGLPYYVEQFKNADYYLNLFEEWITKLNPVRFIS